MSTHSAAAAAILLALAMTGPAHAYTGQELAKEAKITMNQARALALKAHRGAITDRELERESGGTGLRYSFAIGDHEVGVDANTGKILEDVTEGANPD